MARFWKEKLNPNKHTNFMGHNQLGGLSVEPPHDNLIEQWVYFVTVCSFTFQFQSVDQIQECLDYFSQKVHPTSSDSYMPYEHYWQPWEQRLPYWLFEESKRQKVVKALKTAISRFQFRKA